MNDLELCFVIMFLAIFLSKFYLDWKPITKKPRPPVEETERKHPKCYHCHKYDAMCTCFGCGKSICLDCFSHLFAKFKPITFGEEYQYKMKNCDICKRLETQYK